MIADGLDNNATPVGQVEQAQARLCFGGLTAERVSDGFAYDGGADQMVCPEGKRSIGQVLVDHGDLDSCSMRDCKACPRSPACLTRSEREGKAEPRRRVFLSDVPKRQVAAGEAGRVWRTTHLKLRNRIEPKFDEQMNPHGHWRARSWGLAKVTLQVLLNAITVNAKRAVKWLIQAGRPGGPGAALAEVTT